jgi:hypothetical protein
MAIPRPILLALVAAALVLLVAVTLGLGAGQRGDPSPGDAAGPEAAAPATATPAAPRATPRGTTRPPSLPEPVARALAARRVVVLLLADGRAADDAATIEAVRALERRPPAGVTVFRDELGRLARYRAILADLGVSQAPAVAIVGPDHRARLLQGYVDEGTLRQGVADARR